MTEFPFRLELPEYFPVKLTPRIKAQLRAAVLEVPEVLRVRFKTAHGVTAMYGYSTKTDIQTALTNTLTHWAKRKINE